MCIIAETEGDIAAFKDYEDSGELDVHGGSPEEAPEPEQPKVCCICVLRCNNGLSGCCKYHSK